MVIGYPVDIFFWGEYFSMMGVFFALIHPKSGGEDDTAAIRPFWARAPIFRETAKKRAQIRFLMT
jgi:hypothetical protein